MRAPRHTRFWTTFLAAAFLALACRMPEAAPPDVSLRPVASGLASPVEVANAGDGSGRLFIVEQGGTIRILRKSGELLPAAFLNITSSVLSGGEQDAPKPRAPRRAHQAWSPCATWPPMAEEPTPRLIQRQPTVN